jgi:hypothetical protein
MILALTGNGRYGPDDVFILMFFLSVLFDIVLMTWAWQKLDGRLRAAIFDRFSGGEPWLASWRWLRRTLAELFASKGSSTKSAQSH